MQRRVIPSMAGYNEAPWVNYGKMQNRGVDASLALHKALGKDWHIDAIGTFTFVRNKVSEWDEPTQPNSTPTSTRRGTVTDSSSGWWPSASTRTRTSTP